MKIDILSLFPGYFDSPLNESLLKRAIEKGLISIELHDIRSFAKGKHRQVDDRPFGGGPGMVMMPEPISQALHHVKKGGSASRVVYLSASGKPLSAKRARELSKETHLVLLCGHYEGIDERIVEKYVDEEICIGDFVLTNGCIAALALVDAISRFVPGVVGDPKSVDQDSFEGPYLDCPHYTQPKKFEGMDVPDVLLSGHHENIAKWRKEKAINKTKKVRPDLLQKEKVEK